MKRIVVLGGVGLIGSHLCIALAQGGNDVICVDVRDVAESNLLWPYYRRHEIRYINHNVNHPFSLECDQIYNMASPSTLPNDGGDSIAVLRTNILGSMNALDMARRCRSKLLFASSSDVYGVGHHGIFSERESTSVMLTPFAEAKRAAEAIHVAYHHEYGLDCRVARIFSTYGTGCQLEDQRVVMTMIRAALRGHDIVIHGSGEQLRTFCWVGDVVDCLIRMGELPSEDSCRVVNVGSAYEISINYLARKILAMTGSRSQIRYAPPRLGEPRRAMPDLSLSRTRLGWSPTTSLNEGLRLVIEYVESLLSAQVAR